MRREEFASIYNKYRKIELAINYGFILLIFIMIPMVATIHYTYLKARRA
jgi:hypothetical protein